MSDRIEDTSHSLSLLFLVLSLKTLPFVFLHWARGKRRGFSPGAAARHKGRTRVPTEYSRPLSPPFFSTLFEIGRLLFSRSDIELCPISDRTSETSDLAGNGKKGTIWGLWSDPCSARRLWAYSPSACHALKSTHRQAAHIHSRSSSIHCKTLQHTSANCYALPHIAAQSDIAKEQHVHQHAATRCTRLRHSTKTTPRYIILSISSQRARVTCRYLVATIMGWLWLVGSIK